MSVTENNISIQNWVNWLNKVYPIQGGSWSAINGIYTTTQLSFDAHNQPNFNPNSGYPLKGFYNSGTGEVKFFDARRFLIYT